MESSLKAGEVQLKRSGSSQPFSSSQCLMAAPKTGRKGTSEIQHRICAFPTAYPQQGPSAPANPKEQHQQLMGRACNIPGLSSCFAPVQPIPPLVSITSASCSCPLPPGAGFLCASGLHRTRCHHTELQRNTLFGRAQAGEAPGSWWGRVSVFGAHLTPKP